MKRPLLLGLMLLWVVEPLLPANAEPGLCVGPVCADQIKPKREATTGS